LNQYKFKRQKPIAGYIVDFACLERKLIVEADGCQHLAQGDYDAERTRTLEAAGYFVLRFWNDEIMRDTQAVLNTILRALER
jgi:very-short-patch-repair endonuclease